MHRTLLPAAITCCCAAGAWAQTTPLQLSLWHKTSDDASQFTPMYAPKVRAYALQSPDLPPLSGPLAMRV